MSDARSVWLRREQRRRRLRERFFDRRLFADPVWDLLIDLHAATIEGRRVAVSSACIAAAVPPTTALRQIRRMEALGHMERRPGRDHRSSNVRLTPWASVAMDRYLAALGSVDDEPMLLTILAGPPPPLSAIDAIAEIRRIAEAVR